MNCARCGHEGGYPPFTCPKCGHVTVLCGHCGGAGVIDKGRKPVVKKQLTKQRGANLAPMGGDTGGDW